MRDVVIAWCIRMQNIDAMFWLLLPMVGMVLVLLLVMLRAKSPGSSKRGTIVGLIIAAAIVVTYVLLRYVVFPE
ncbi:MAG: hypothetical protein ACXADC_16180 [Candidatus Thorarchaeota archaeon]|jgi:hypothetical protein